MNGTFIVVGSCIEGCGGSTGEETEGRCCRGLPQRNGTLGPYLPHLVSQTQPSLSYASQACLVRELGQGTAKGGYLFSQEGKIRVKYERGSGILALLTGCYLLIKFGFGLFPILGLCSSSYRSCRLW